MAQHDYVIANGTGAAVRSDINNGLAAIVSNNSGTSEPATMYAYQWWADTTTGLLKIRNAANNAWVTVGTLASANLGLLTSGSTIVAPLGDASTPGITFTGDLNTGIFSPTADQLAISTSGTERVEFGTAEVVFNDGGANYDFRIEGDTNSSLFFVDASAEAVGIGTASPTGPLSVVSDSGGLGARLLGRASDGIGTFQFRDNGDTSTYGFLQGRSTDFRISSGTGLPLLFLANDSERARIDSDGRLLVGTSTSPAPGGNVASFVGANNANTSTTSNFAVYTNTAQAANVGGTISLGGYWTTASDYFPFGSISGRKANSTSGNAEGYLQFNISDNSFSLVEAMRINAASELLIGYTTDNGAYKLQVNSQIFATSATVATSDGRYKENVDSLGGCLDLVKALRPVSFTWKPQEDITRTDDDGNEVLVREGHNFPEGTQVGFIAQEVQEVLTDKPWLNSVIKENVRPAVLDDEGNEMAPEEQFFGIAEGNLIAVLTNALQEAVAQIETLKDRVASLEAQ
jgi:hypothetical protein